MKTLAALVSALLTAIICLAVFVGLASSEEVTANSLLTVSVGSFMLAFLISMIMHHRR